MTKWITSDIHLSHKRILTYCKNRVCPEFRGDINIAIENEDETEIKSLVDWMNEKIIANWNSVVEPGDDVYILGDVSMGIIANAPPLIRRLNGKKYLVAGNHDKTLIKLIEKTPEYHDLFVWIKDYAEMSHTVDGIKHRICMLHYPMKFWNGSGNSSIHFHGHCHGSPTGIDGKILDVGMDTNNLYPYLLDTAINLVIQNSNSHHH